KLPSRPTGHRCSKGHQSLFSRGRASGQALASLTSKRSYTSPGRRLCLAGIYYPYAVYANDAIPGWTAYIGGVSQSDIIYNTRPLDAAEVTLQGTNSNVLTPIEGNFTVVLFGASSSAPQQSAGIGQTGQIPSAAQSLIFWGYAGLDNVSFNAQALSLLVLGNTANYNIYGADISAFAGQSGELLFTAPPGYEDIIDNIQFSSSPIPEPGIISLFAFGGSLFAFRRRRKSSRWRLRTAAES
ncbi:MAG: PEP-CTERM sorting domain-containing protein, partial [Verrucomicrobiota bacterium]|nr:PEP-CTERM sorting domain-containing protein [Verrucomicrobiota bacterium]